MNEPSFVAETLAWCNEMREEREMVPLDVLPKGARRNPASCPCGKATGLRVFSTWADDDERSPSLPVPAAVAAFIGAFDAGELPQYDEAIA